MSAGRSITPSWANSALAGPRRPIRSPTTTNVDAGIGYGRRLWKDRVTWKAQLNVRNIGTGEKLIPVGTQPDGSTYTYRIGAGMGWTLTNSFNF